MLSEEERKQLISKLNISFCMPELWKNKDSFLNLTDLFDNRIQYNNIFFKFNTNTLRGLKRGRIVSTEAVSEFPDPLLRVVVEGLVLSAAKIAGEPSDLPAARA